MPSDAPLFKSLDREWIAFAHSGEARDALLRWAAAEPELAGFTSLDDLLEALRGRTEPDRRDQRMLALLRIARQDPVARRLALQVVRPALSVIARHYSGRWGAEDAASVVVVVALERIAIFPTERRHTNLAGQIVLDTRHVLFASLAKELALEEAFDRPTNLAASEHLLVAPPERTAADRVAGIVTDAVRAKRITPRHAQLVLARLAGVPLHEIAAAWRRPPQSVRRMRQRAERVLADVAVA